MDIADSGTEGVFVHEYRRFVQAELDARGWEPPELVRRAGVNRQLVWKILKDDREHLGQMPDDATMEAIATGFGIDVERVRTAAARSLRGYADDGHPITTDLAAIDIDILLAEIRRRVTTPVAVNGSHSPKRPPIGRLGRKGARENRADNPD